MSDSAPNPVRPEGVTRARHSRERFCLRRGVKGLVTSEESVLLVRERHTDGTPFWTLPGGGIESGETARTALKRELDEELQCVCVPGGPVASFPYVHSSLERTASVYVVYDCGLLTKPEPNESHGVWATRWATPGSLPVRTLPQVRAVVSRILA